MDGQNQLDQEIKLIHERNRRVEAEKAWELSWLRRLFISLVTYITAGIWLVLINDTTPWLKALVPTVGYLFSTLSIPILKKWWIIHRFK